MWQSVDPTLFSGFMVAIEEVWDEKPYRPIGNRPAARGGGYGVRDTVRKLG
jgi:hypothetical protein